MRKYLLFILFILLFSCTKYEDYYCWVIDYIYVGEDKIKVDEFRCGCGLTTPKPQEYFEYEGQLYPVSKEMECYN